VADHLQGEGLAQITIDKFVNKSARVAVVGLGYVGLPLAVLQGKTGFHVTGIDIDDSRVNKLKEGKNYIQDVNDQDLIELLAAGKLDVTTNFSLLRDMNVVIICVPTPLNELRQPDLSFITSATGEVARNLQRGQLIILESTTFPGTTEEVVLPVLESTGLSVGRDFFLAFSPERVDPGNKLIRLMEISKVVGGVTPLCLDLAGCFYAQAFNQVVPVSSPAVAEMTKIFENTYRAVNIALVNEFMILCDRMGLDIWEIVDAAATKPFGIQTFYPGPGVGGHCIPVDPTYLAWKAMEYDCRVRFIELTGDINSQMPGYVIRKLNILLNKYKKCLHGARILLLGAAYKKDVADVRESPALKILAALFQYRADALYWDPYVEQLRLPGPPERVLHSVNLTEQEIARADCVLITTDHSDVDYQWVTDHARLVLDTRNATKNITRGREKVTKI